MISREDFAKVGRGDVLIYRCGPRLILHGPRDFTDGRGLNMMAVTLAKRNRSKFHNGITVHSAHDVMRLASLPPADFSSASIRRLHRLELERCKGYGIRVNYEVTRQRKQHERWAPKTACFQRRKKAAQLMLPL